MRILIDGDPIIYRIGFANEKPHYHAYVDDGEFSYVRHFVPDDKGTAHAHYKAWLEEHPDVQVDLEKEIVVNDWDEVEIHVDDTIEEIIDAVMERFPTVHPEDIEPVVLLSGPGNFREEIATIRKYKGNRDSAHKPHWYQQIRNHLTDFWQAEVIEGHEADDELAIRQYAGNGDTIICTIDKDLDMVPGWHYNYFKKEVGFYTVSRDEGLRFFYKQILTGDVTDNIPGAYKIGKAKADKIIDEVVAEHGTDERRMWEAVMEAYSDTLVDHGEKCEYFDAVMERGLEDVVIEQARLVWMLSKPGERWTPPAGE